MQIKMKSCHKYAIKMFKYLRMSKKKAVLSALPQAGSRRKYVRTFVQTTIFLARKSTLKRA